MTAEEGQLKGGTPFVLRRALLGYKRADVIAALEEQSRQVAALASSVNRLYTEREQLRPALAEKQAEVERMRATERSRLEQVESEARASSARIVAEAEEEALRVRQTIGTRIAEGTSRLEELLRVREGLVGDLRTTLTDYEHTLGRLERGAEHGTGHADPIRTERPVVAAVPDRPEVAQIFPRRVELHAGPFDDFTELSSFERSLAGLPTVEDVYIRAFEAHRAVIELVLAEERPLLRDLAVHVPYEIAVASSDGETLNIDVRGRSAVAG